MSNQTWLLKELGVERWFVRHPEMFSAGVDGQDDVPEGHVMNDDWNEVQQEALSCTACSLSETRTQVVFGVGNQQADWVVVGEAPGKDEDLQGEPFVGRAGKLLNQMLLAVGLSRDRVYICNTLKCRPPKNRDPQPDEISHCRHFLDAQMRLLAPKVILVVGRIAAQTLLQTQTPIGQLRGKLQHYGAQKVPVVVTYHPAYLLRSPKSKRAAWQDLQLAYRVAKDLA